MRSKKHIKSESVGARTKVVWGITFIFSIFLIFIGNTIATQDLDIFNVEDAYAAKAIVTEIGQKETSTYELSEGVSSLENTVQYFDAKILNTKFKGETVLAAQTSDNYTAGATEEPVQVGDKVVLYNYGVSEGDADWVFGGYERLDGILVLIGIFCFLVIVFGRFKGLNTVISLAFTCLAVFACFVPAVLNGYNVYVWTFFTCVFTISMTLLITNGATNKSFTTMLGCTFGVIVAAILSIVFDKALKLTGMIDEHSIYLTQLNTESPINLNALIFAMITIGAMGAVMDVAMDISSSLYELHTKAEHLSFIELFTSGIHIGRDVMGTMANTLVLAYIGSNLCATLLYITYTSSLYELLNKENIIVEMLNAFVGSTAILLTIPLTSLVCAFLYTRNAKDKNNVTASRLNIDPRKFEEWKSSVESIKTPKNDLVQSSEDLEKRRTLIPKDPVMIYFDDKDRKKKK